MGADSNNFIHFLFGKCYELRQDCQKVVDNSTFVHLFMLMADLIGYQLVPKDAKKDYEMLCSIFESFYSQQGITSSKNLCTVTESLLFVAYSYESKFDIGESKENLLFPLKQIYSTSSQVKDVLSKEIHQGNEIEIKSLELIKKIKILEKTRTSVSNIYCLAVVNFLVNV